jgi:hypothetical protein
MNLSGGKGKTSTKPKPKPKPGHLASINMEVSESEWWEREKSICPDGLV